MMRRRRKVESLNRNGTWRRMHAFNTAFVGSAMRFLERSGRNIASVIDGLQIASCRVRARSDFLNITQRVRRPKVWPYSKCSYHLRDINTPASNPRFPIGVRKRAAFGSPSPLGAKKLPPTHTHTQTIQLFHPIDLPPCKF